MRLSNLTVYKDSELFILSPFTVRLLPSNKTQSFLLKLINDSFFKKSTIKLRAKYKIPANGYPSNILDNYKYKYRFSATLKDSKEFPLANGNYDIESLWLKMKKDLKILVNHFQFSSLFTWQFFLLITYNAFIEIDSKEQHQIEFSTGKKELISRINELSDPIGAILIKSNITKSDLKKWIDQNWEYTEDDFAKGYSKNVAIRDDLNTIMPKKFVERGTLKSLKIDGEIVNLINMGKTNTEIGKMLIELFPNEDKVYGQEWVNLHISRLKKRLKRL